MTKQLKKEYQTNKLPGSALPDLKKTKDWLKDECQRLVDKYKLLEFLADVASGKHTEMWISQTGKVVERPVEVETRMKAVAMLLDRGYGKPFQDMQLSGNVGGKMIIKRPNDR